VLLVFVNMLFVSVINQLSLCSLLTQEAERHINKNAGSASPLNGVADVS
jgi:hypothetical protein